MNAPTFNNNIALCLSTEPRFWEVTAENTKYIKHWAKERGINLHVFIHVWDELSIRYDQQEYKQIFKTKKYEKKDFVFDYNIEINKLIDEFQPTDCLVENKDILDEYTEQFIIQPHKKYIQSEEWVQDEKHLQFRIKYTNEPCISQIYSMLKSFQLASNYAKTNNIQYDIIIRSRLDQALYQILNNDPQYCLARINKLKKNSIRYNLLCPRLCVNPGRNLWMEYAVFLGSSTFINTTALNNFEEKLYNITLPYIKDKIHERTSHFVVPEYIIQYMKPGINGGNTKPGMWKYKLNHLSRQIYTSHEYRSTAYKLHQLEIMRTKKMYEHLKF